MVGTVLYKVRRVERLFIESEVFLWRLLDLVGLCTYDG